MSNRTAPPNSASAVEDFIFDGAPPAYGAANDNAQDGPAWVWVLVRASSEPKQQQVWVRYQAEQAPEGLSVRAANPPRDGDDGVAIVEARSARRLALATPERKSVDPDLLTVAEFSSLVGIAESSVFELLKKGLPSFKSPHVGRRIKRAQALAWLAEGGATRSRIARRMAKQAREQKVRGSP